MSDEKKKVGFWEGIGLIFINVFVITLLITLVSVGVSFFDVSTWWLTSRCIGILIATAIPTMIAVFVKVTEDN